MPLDPECSRFNGYFGTSDRPALPQAIASTSQNGDLGSFTIPAWQFEKEALSTIVLTRYGGIG
ncbi:MAG: hypothetical protein DMG57_41630 [Acidobacteria bacterium]|nr:MAG: hypothetical protein DMG57_41630 [Acidobacteriota bacterium]